MDSSQKILLTVCKEFSSTPGPRYISEGDFSGELFRNKVLGPALQNALKEDVPLVVDLDGTAGFGTSFLEEAFGGLIRESGIPYKTVSGCIELISLEEPYLIKDIREYIEEARDAN
ncbi:MAG: STAS-like domain-containing protein [Bacteroidales bacterium]|nr:STAS-like domain-containing protein [Candidatus Latescibacterota bacterium]